MQALVEHNHEGALHRIGFETMDINASGAQISGECTSAEVPCVSQANSNARTGGGSIFSHNTIINVNQTTHIHFNEAGQRDVHTLRVSTTLLFREVSTSHREADDDTAGARTAGIGQWFLSSPQYMDWKNARVLNLMCTESVSMLLILLTPPGA